MSSKIKQEFLKLLEKDIEFRYAIAGYLGISELLKRFDKHDEELIKLREDMNKLREDMNRGFELMNRHLDALGARWGILSEEAFKEGIKGILEKEIGLKVEKWSSYDNEGLVYGYPSNIEIDVAMHNEKIILIEVKSHAKTSDIYELKRKAELYEKITNRKPDRLIIVSPYIEGKAIDACKKIGIEAYTKI